MRDASFAGSSMLDRAQTWRELYRCDDLRQARAVATTIAAMEFDVRLCSTSPSAWSVEREAEGEGEVDRQGAGETLDTMRSAFAARHSIHGCGPVCCSRISNDDELPGPYVIEVRDDTWPQLADVLFEIIAEQQEFDQMLEWRHQRNHVRLVLVLSATTAAEVFLIWRLLES
jgi:hypothetical protein